MDKIVTEVNRKVNLELALKTLIVYGVFSLAGVVGIVAGVLFGQVLGYDSFSVVIILVACSALVVMSCGLVVMLIVRMKKNESEHIVIETEFNDESVYAVNYKNGEKSSDSTIRYSEFMHYRETKDYVYLFPNKVTALPLKKCEGLTAFLDGKNVKRKKF